MLLFKFRGNQPVGSGEIDFHTKFGSDQRNSF